MPTPTNAELGLPEVATEDAIDSSPSDGIELEPTEEGPPPTKLVLYTESYRMKLAKLETEKERLLKAMLYPLNPIAEDRAFTQLRETLRDIATTNADLEKAEKREQEELIYHNKGMQRDLNAFVEKTRYRRSRIETGLLHMQLSQIITQAEQLIHSLKEEHALLTQEVTENEKN